MLRLDLHQRFILHVHFALALAAAARCVPFGRGCAELRNGVQLDRIGFDLDHVRQRQSSRPSLGLAGMEERAALLGGTVIVQSRPDYGTEVEALIPYHHTGGNHRLQEVKDEHTPVISG